MHMRPAKAQTSLRIRAVSSEHLLIAHTMHGPLKIYRHEVNDVAKHSLHIYQAYIQSQFPRLLVAQREEGLVLFPIREP